MDKKTDRKIKEYVSEVAKQYPGLLASYLFGSYAKNKQTPDSDIDIALILDNIEDGKQFDLDVRLLVLGKKFDMRIEPHTLSQEDFSDPNYQLAYEIKKYGKPIVIGAE